MAENDPSPLWQTSPRHAVHGSRRTIHGGKRQVLLTGNSIHFSALRRMSENDLGVNIGMFSKLFKTSKSLSPVKCNLHLRQPLNPVFLYHKDHAKLPLRGVLELQDGDDGETLTLCLSEFFEPSALPAYQLKCGPI